VSKTIAEQMDEARDAWRVAWLTFGDAVIDTRGFRAFARFAKWADERIPALGWLDRVMPRWLRFGTHEFFQMVGTLYLIFAAGVAVGLGIQWLSER
jgi:hypothetical protein